MVRYCCVAGCTNNSKHILKWNKEFCRLHKRPHGQCYCMPPFNLITFPTERKDPEGRKKWTKIVYRKNRDGSNWQPTSYDRVCSKHFKDCEPTIQNPYPTLHLGYKDLPAAKTIKKRIPVHERVAQRPPQQPLKATETNFSGERQSTDQPLPLNSPDFDHSYYFQCQCSKGCKCDGCLTLHKEVLNLRHELMELKSKQNTSTSTGKKTAAPVTDTILKNDADVRRFTGLPSKATFHALVNHFSPSAQKMQYWTGKKRTFTSAGELRKPGKKSPLKHGPQRKLTSEEELSIVLLKLKLNLSTYFLSSLFSVSPSLVSQIFNTWVKFLAVELQPLIFWPDKELVLTSMPVMMKKKYPSLRCTIDCTEVFIERPRNLELQALTWSDYKQHNTVKFLVAITPNGMISFLSKAWGGRVSDRTITLESGFLNLIDPGDVILADRGFTIKEDLLLRRAHLQMPPPSKGIEQMTTADALKTKKISNARIHVERAIGRMKNFRILQETLPITMVPLVDDIITICAAIANMQPPLVK